jgi:hypothetical protein
LVAAHHTPDRQRATAPKKKAPGPFDPGADIDLLRSRT